MLPSGETAGEAGGGCKGFLRMSTAGQNSALLSQLGGGRVRGAASAPPGASAAASQMKAHQPAGRWIKTHTNSTTGFSEKIRHLRTGLNEEAGAPRAPLTLN